MRNILVIFFLFFLSGCLTTLHNSPTTKDSPQRQAQTESICQRKSIDLPKISSTKNIIADFKKAPAVSDITEFETHGAFQERASQHLSLFAGRTFFVYIQPDHVFSEIKYDAYMNRFIFTVKNYPAPVYSSYAKQEQFPSNILIDSDYTSQGSYLGANALGAVASVKKGKVVSTVLNITNIKDIAHYTGVDVLYDLLRGVGGLSLEIPASKAENMKKDLKILCEFSPSPHYVNEKRFGFFDITKKAEAPTLSSPYATMQIFNVLFVSIKGFYLVNTKTGDVLGGACF